MLMITIFKQHTDSTGSETYNMVSLSCTRISKGKLLNPAEPYFLPLQKKDGDTGRRAKRIGDYLLSVLSKVPGAELLLFRN